MYHRQLTGVKIKYDEQVMLLMSIHLVFDHGNSVSGLYGKDLFLDNKPRSQYFELKSRVRSISIRFLNERANGIRFETESEMVEWVPAS